MPRTVRDVVFVDGVRTPFGKAGGVYANTRADDLVIRCIRELLRRNPHLPPERVDEVAIAATAQTGDQGMTIGRTAALLAGLPSSVPGYAIDRMCAGAMTAVTNVASAIAIGAYDVAIAGGVEHMGHHPMGAGVDPNPRILVERLVEPSALVMGQTAENLHDRLPGITRERADRFGLASQVKTAKAYAAGKLQPDLVPVAVRDPDTGWGLSTVDEAPRDTSMEKLATLRTPFRPHGRVTAGNSAGLNDGATACLIAAEEVAGELGLPPRVFPVFGMAVGFPDPAASTSIKPRLPPAAVVHREQYATVGHPAAIAAYDLRMRMFHAEQKMAPGGWAEKAVNRVRTPASLAGRDRMRAVLARMGFELR